MRWIPDRHRHHRGRVIELLPGARAAVGGRVPGRINRFDAHPAIALDPSWNETGPPVGAGDTVAVNVTGSVSKDRLAEAVTTVEVERAVVVV